MLEPIHWTVPRRRWAIFKSIHHWAHWSSWWQPKTLKKNYASIFLTEDCNRDSATNNPIKKQQSKPRMNMELTNVLSSKKAFFSLLTTPKQPKKQKIIAKNKVLTARSCSLAMMIVTFRRSMNLNQMKSNNKLWKNLSGMDI